MVKRREINLNTRAVKQLRKTLELIEVLADENADSIAGPIPREQADDGSVGQFYLLKRYELKQLIGSLQIRSSEVRGDLGMEVLNAMHAAGDR